MHSKPKMIIAQPYLNLMGGAERVILQIAKHYDAKIYTMEYSKDTTFPEFQNIDIRMIGENVAFADKLPYRASQGLRYGYNFHHMKISEDYDLINSHISPSEWIRHKNPRVLWYCHTPPREVYDLYAERMKNRTYAQKLLYASFASAYKIISKGIVKELEAVATNSNNTRERIKKYLGRDATVINPGIEAKDFTNAGDGNLFLYPSRIIQTKRQDYVIDAFTRFKKKAKNSRHKLIIAGTLSKDKEHLAYFERLKAMKAKDVIFRLNVSDRELKRLYSTSTAVLFAARNEDFGIVPLEGMASSKPVIAVNEGGIKETVVNGITGFAISTPEEMAERMRFVVEHPRIAEHMGKEGRARVEKEYSWESFFMKFDAMARKVAQSGTEQRKK